MSYTVVEVEIRDDSLVYKKDKEGDLVNPRPRASVWWQKYKFKGGQAETEARAMAAAKQRWPSATSWKLRPSKDVKSALLLEKKT